MITAVRRRGETSSMKDGHCFCQSPSPTRCLIPSEEDSDTLLLACSYILSAPHISVLPVDWIKDSSFPFFWNRSFIDSDSIESMRASSQYVVICECVFVTSSKKGSGLGI